MPRSRLTSSNQVDVTLTVATGVSVVTIRRWSETTRRRLPTIAGRVSVAAVSPIVSRRLNRTYRGFDRPTNVLSFVHCPDASQTIEPIGGEIILCPQVIRREAHEQRRPYRSYVKFLLDHGFIHLLGLDHQTSSEQKRWQRYTQLLEKS